MNDEQKRKIVVIDDDHTACNLISRTLEPEGFEVFIVSDPEKAVETAKQKEPVLIFIGLLSFGSEGLRICKSIHSLKNFRTLPVVMMIPYPGEMDPRYAATLGIVDIIVKPLNAGELISKTMRVLRKDAVMPESYEVSRESSSVREGVGALHGEEKPGGSEPAGAETMLSAGESSGDEMDKHEETYTDKEPEEDLAGQGFEPYHEMEKQHFRKHLLKYVSVLVFLAFGFGVLLFTGAGKKLAGIFSGGTSGIAHPDREDEVVEAFPEDETKSETVFSPSAIDKPEEPSGIAYPDKEERMAEQLPEDDIKTGEVFPPAVAYGPETAVSPFSDAGRQKGIRKKRTPPKKSEFLKATVYSVQVGAFGNKGNAEALADKLRQKGYIVFVLEDSGADRETVYRVLIGKFDRRSGAMEYSRTLSRKEGIESFIFSE